MKDSTNTVWKTQAGFYSMEDQAFIEEPGEREYVPLYMDTSDPDNLILADKEFIRATLIFYNLPVGGEVKISMDKIKDIQDIYIPQLTVLREAKAGAEMRDDADDVAEIKAEYMALLQEMNQKIQAVPND